MLDWPAFGAALWRVNDELGIRPEVALPVLWLESGFEPSSMNPIGCVGLNQFCGATYTHYVPGVPKSEYRSWAASRQLEGPIFNYWRDARAVGPIDSAARLMVSQLSQAALARTTSPDSIVFASPSAEYEANRLVFDPSGKGFFTVRDLAGVLARKAASPAVQDALARTYAMRPGEYPHEDYVYSTVTPPVQRSGIVGKVLVSALIVGAAGLVVYGVVRATSTTRTAPVLPRPRPFRYTVPPQEGA